MEAIKYLGLDFDTVLTKMRADEELLDYSKIEGFEFLMLKEKGFFLSSLYGERVITSCKLYFVEEEGYFPAKNSVRGKYSNIKSFEDMEKLLGPCTKVYRGLKIPGGPLILPSREYEDGKYLVSAAAKDGTEITCISIKLK
ncbi:hypothetical protein [Parathalassolituus penaei]|uniref:Uncharacterized protein n=1 Tax=Parathalassolituus penaei TaxID=2997323 RepID=A0A9X3IRE7_9GAMM|nr:hypothetical protein [Parathalassolituus penaei]MCY0965152.1 hypothetical protein [Parathalassolituus penaei]